jgi:hypothetical protein
LADVKAQRNAAGDYAIGVEVEGVFIPFAAVSAARIQHAVERRQNLEQRASENDEEAQQVLDADYGGEAEPEAESAPEGKAG